MDPKRIVMMIIWLAALGAVIVYGSRVVGNLQTKAGI